MMKRGKLGNFQIKIDEKKLMKIFKVEALILLLIKIEDKKIFQVKKKFKLCAFFKT